MTDIKLLPLEASDRMQFIQSSFKLFGDNVSCQDEKSLLTHD